ncbi:hypothetical protein HPP92_016932 [Vanilla planifolia]|uniref:Uncharacterized protein n=1 Tax=Vanilla planifolia TaxID=51239 RepID=A0A835QM42_VANPL|nr:hypothetical protein HPP92_016932 [Vanilla planifolia]
MGRTLKLVTTLTGEAAGALMSSPHSPRSRLPVAAPRQLQRMAVRRRRDGRIGLETILEEDPSLGSEANEECFSTSGKSSHAGFRDQFGGGLGINELYSK